MRGSESWELHKGMDQDILVELFFEVCLAYWIANRGVFSHTLIGSVKEKTKGSEQLQS